MMQKWILLQTSSYRYDIIWLYLFLFIDKTYFDLNKRSWDDVHAFTTVLKGKYTSFVKISFFFFYGRYNRNKMAFEGNGGYNFISFLRMFTE